MPIISFLLSVLCEINMPELSRFFSYGSLCMLLPFFSDPFGGYSMSFTVASVADEYPTDLLSDSVILLPLFYEHMLYISLKPYICPCTFQRCLHRSLRSVTRIFYEWFSYRRRHYFLQCMLF